MPVMTAIALLAIALGIKRRERLLAPVGGDPAWTAALGGIVALGVAGALFNDSGPVLLLFATVIGAVLVVYLRGDARLAAPASDRPPAPGGAGPAPRRGEALGTTH
jgi:hypothetical protein